MDPADDGDVVSIPFMGFRGSFQDIPAVEKPIYNLVREGKSGFYYDVPETKHVPSNANVTSLVSNVNDVLYTTAKKETAERSPIVLGTVETPEGLNVLHLDADGKCPSGYFSRWRWEQRLRAISCSRLAKPKKYESSCLQGR